MVILIFTVISIAGVIGTIIGLELQKDMFEKGSAQQSPGTMQQSLTKSYKSIFGYDIWN